METMKTTVSAFLLSSLIALAAAAATPVPFVLADEGLAQAVVVVAKDAPKGVRYAANESLGGQTPAGVCPRKACCTWSLY